MTNHQLAKNIASGLIIVGVVTTLIAGHWLSDTQELWSYDTSMDPSQWNEWHKAQYRATFMPAVLYALGFMCSGLGFTIYGASRDKLDVIGIVSMAFGMMFVLPSLVIILNRIVSVLSL